MHRQILVVLTLLPLARSTTAAEDGGENSRFSFLPGHILVQPFAANYQEPCVGVRKQIGSSRLKLDIGSTLDVVEYAFSTEKSNRLRAGIDFFSYALSTSAEGHRLQIDAADGFFGGHVSFQSS